MNVERTWGFLGRALGLLTITAVLAGCGGSGSDGSAATAASPSTSSDTPAIASGSSSSSSGAAPVAAAPSSSSSSGGASVSGTLVAASSSSSSSGAAPVSASDSVTLSWAAPTENTDGSALTNLAGYVIYYGSTGNTMTQKINITSVGMLNYVVSNLNAGTWYFEILAVNSSGVESNPSGVVSTTIS